LSGMRRRHAHRGGQPVAHRAEAARRAPAARVLEPVVLRGPHLVLADAGDDIGLTPREIRDLLDHGLRLDQLIVPVEPERMARPPRRARPTCGRPCWRSRPRACRACRATADARRETRPGPSAWS